MEEKRLELGEDYRSHDIQSETIMKVLEPFSTNSKLCNPTIVPPPTITLPFDTSK